MSMMSYLLFAPVTVNTGTRVLTTGLEAELEPDIIATLEDDIVATVEDEVECG